MARSNENLIIEALDREAIRDLIVRYYDAIWRNDIDAVVQLFALDGTIEVVNGPLAGNAPVGHAQLHAFYLAGVQKISPRPFGHNHLVELHGDGSASGRSYVELRSSIDFSWVAAVIYTDQYAKVEDGWKIRRREAQMQITG